MLPKCVEMKYKCQDQDDVKKTFGLILLEKTTSEVRCRCNSSFESCGDISAWTRGPWPADIPPAVLRTWLKATSEAHTFLLFIWITCCGKKKKKQHMYFSIPCQCCPLIGGFWCSAEQNLCWHFQDMSWTKKKKKKSRWRKRTIKPKEAHARQEGHVRSCKSEIQPDRVGERGREGVLWVLTRRVCRGNVHRQSCQCSTGATWESCWALKRSAAADAGERRSAFNAGMSWTCVILTHAWKTNMSVCSRDNDTCTTSIDLLN